MAEVIDLSDDDYMETESGDPLSVKPKSFKCLNTDCCSKENLIKASSNVRRFYGVLSYPKKTKVCAKCSAYAKIHADALIDSVRTGKFFVMSGQNEKRNAVVLMDSDSDLTDAECESEESEYEFDPSEFYSFPKNQQNKCSDMEVDEEYDEDDPQERVRELISNISEELGLRDQIDEGAKNLKLRLTAAESGFEILNDEYSNIEAKLDKLRNDFYSAFRQDIKWLPPIDIGPTLVPQGTDTADVIPEPLIETAAVDLPPIGQLERTELKLQEKVFSIKHSLLANWVDATVMGVEKRDSSNKVYRICYTRKTATEKIIGRTIPARHLAYFKPANSRIPVGTRIIAKFKDECQPTLDDGSFFVGIVAEIPNGANKYRYLIFFDDGYAQYVAHGDIRVVVECSPHPWEDVASDSKEFIKDYLHTYPERPMVRLVKKSYIVTECDGEWIKARVLEVDGSLVKMYFPSAKNRIARTEWIYRGSTRLSPLFNKKIDLQSKTEQKNKVIRRRTMPFNKSGPFVEYVNQERETSTTESTPEVPTERRAVARKSTSGRPGTPPQEVQELIFQESRGFVRKKPVDSYLPPFKPHQCSSKCAPNTTPIDENISPLMKPILRNWRRQISREKKRTVSRNVVSYVAPCGRRLRNIEEVFRFLRLTESDLEIDFFTFEFATDPTTEWEPAKKNFVLEDISNGIEKMAISCVNSLDKKEPLPLIYRNVRQPTKNVNLNLDPAFLVCCSCTDDCQDKSRCECWQMTIEANKIVNRSERTDIAYRYRRLPDQVASGIYECNSQCSCNKTCLNRVVQHPIKQKLQLFKTARRGWGVRTLHDIPQGTFVSVYVGNVLNEAVANEEGKMTTGGDDYYAELDFIEIIEEMKEGYESDVEEDPDFEVDSNERDLESIHISGVKTTSNGPDMSLLNEDGDYIETTTTAIDKQPPEQRERSARIQARSKRNSSLNSADTDSGNSSPSRDGDDSKDNNNDDEDDVQQRKRQTFEPMDTTTKPPKEHRPIRELFGEDEAVYIMDARVSGNIGRYFNHSCQPNIFVQNVFVDTHDMRFPWVAFFTSTRIRAGMELTWDYNYEIGSVPGKIKYCYCMSRKCRGRLL